MVGKVTLEDGALILKLGVFQTAVDLDQMSCAFNDWKSDKYVGYSHFWNMNRLYFIQYKIYEKIIVLAPILSPPGGAPLGWGHSKICYKMKYLSNRSIFIKIILNKTLRVHKCLPLVFCS